MPDDADQADSTPTNEPNPKPVKGEGEEQSKRSRPDTNRPDTSEEELPKPPSDQGRGFKEFFSDIFNPDSTEADAIKPKMARDDERARREAHRPSPGSYTGAIGGSRSGRSARMLVLPT